MLNKESKWIEGAYTQKIYFRSEMNHNCMVDKSGHCLSHDVTVCLMHFSRDVAKLVENQGC